jgi:KDO2-lipid IV(A) lauroyltransferase
MIVLYKLPTKKWMRPLVRSSRAAPGFEALPADVAGVRAMLRALRSRGAVALLPDQVPSAGDGRWAPFFGRPAYTSTLPQRLVERTGAKVVLGICERLPAGRGWQLRLEEIVESPSPELLNACFEQAIRRRPEQYLWGYSRYKAPASVSRGGAPQPDSQGD